MKTQQFYLTVALALCASTISIHAQEATGDPEPTSIPPGPETSTAPAPTTTTAAPPSGQPYGALCNGLLLRCNRYSETVACLQRRPDPTTTTAPEPTSNLPPTTESPIISMFRRRENPTPSDICETGLGVDLGRCQCSRNCKEGVYVDDGMFDEEREICVGLVGSRCSLLVPNCVKNGRCNLLASVCACDPGYVADENRRCVPRV